tara:strand:+ start:883 stop:1464 length:582 start_codon:yes stop_codon:yes gene_type:complete
MFKKIILLISILFPFIAYFFYAKFLKIKIKKYPFIFLSLISAILIIFSLGSLRFYDNYSPKLIKPNISLNPLDVISIQLSSLKRNNIPFKDAGIKQVWEFSHPNNKIITGPLEKFKNMIYSKSYRMLIEHENSEIIILSENKNKSVYKVYILSDEKKRYSYIWQIEKVETDGDLKNCWMTTSVSAPEFLGEVI